MITLDKEKKSYLLCKMDKKKILILGGGEPCSSVSKRCQWVKALATKTEDLSLIAETCPWKLTSDLADGPCQTSMHIYTYRRGRRWRERGREGEKGQANITFNLSKRTIVLTSYGEASRSKKKEKSRHNTEAWSGLRTSQPCQLSVLRWNGQMHLRRWRDLL